MATEIQTIGIPVITLEWSAWIAWSLLHLNVQFGGAAVPNGVPGVYEVKYANSDERLTIGKASDLRMRVKQGLVKGKVPHSSGAKIRAFEDVQRIVVRWAETNRPAAVEEELHQKYYANFGKLPKYVHHT